MGIYYLPGPTISAGESMSAAVDCGGNQILRIVTPDGWDAAPLTFQLSPDNAKFHDLYHVQPTAGAFVPYEVVVPMVPDGAALSMPDTTGARIFWVRFRSGTKSIPVVQSNDRMFSIVMWVPDAAGGDGSGLQTEVDDLEARVVALEAMYVPQVTNAQMYYAVTDVAGDALYQFSVTGSPPTGWVIVSETMNDVPTSGYWDIDASGNVYANGAIGQLHPGDAAVVVARATNDFGSGDGNLMMGFT